MAAKKESLDDKNLVYLMNRQCISSIVTESYRYLFMVITRIIRQ